MNIILLSGGSGTRLWPLSNNVRSKQFLKFFDGKDGKISMIQRMYRMIKETDPSSVITVATSQNQVPQIKLQLGEDVNICVEPCRKDTFPAIVLACSYLIENGVSEDDSVVICPVDPFVEKSYFSCLKELSNMAKDNDKNLYLMGINPTYPSEKYGYIFIENGIVTGFKEKPTEDLARKYIEEGALWNSGVFAFKIKYILDIALKTYGFNDYKLIYQNYDKLEKISFDYAVAEKEKEIGVIRFNGEWKDLGTWNTITEAMTDKCIGNIVCDKCNNTHIINELSIPLISLGINNAVIVATYDGILVSDKNNSSYLKDYVKLRRPMYEKREWGEYKVLDYNELENQSSLTKHLIIEEGKGISYQLHHLRTEIWTIVDGEGKLILDGQSSIVSRGTTVVIKPGTKHAIFAKKELQIIEVQLGEELSEDDIERFELI